LVASLIDQGLNMSEAAELVRTGGARPTVLRHQAPVATVTLAEIYASQGHVKRASSMLDEVLRKEPDHQFARALRDRLPGGKPAEALETSAAPASEPPLSDTEPPSAPASEPPVSDTEPPSAPASEPPLSDTVPPSARPERAEFSEVAPHAQRSPEPIAAESNATPPSPDGDEDADTPRAPPVVPARADLPAETTRSEVRTPAVTPFVPSSDVLLIKRSAATEVSVYWELVPAHAMETVVRLVAFVPDWAGAQRVEHQLSALGAVGTASVQVPEGAIVRAVIGSQLGGVFRPLAVGVEIRGSERPEVAWAPSPVFQERIAPALDRAFAALA
jgi:hypothetical protein